MAEVDVAHVEAGALARQAARAQRGQAPLVRQLGQRVRLVHELRELRAAEELLDGGDHRPDVDQLAGRRLRRVRDRHALADHALHAQEADAELVLDQLAHRADAAVAQVVDVVGPAFAVVEADDLAHDGEEVRGREDSLRSLVPAQSLVDLVAADLAQVVAPRVEEQRRDEPLGVVDRRRVAGPQAPVELQQCLFLGLGAGVAVKRRLDVLVLLASVNLFEKREHAVVRAQQLQYLRAQLVGLALCLGGLDLLLDRADLLRARVLWQKVRLVDRAQEGRNGDLALAVDLDGDDVLVGGLELQPGAAVRDQLGVAERASAGGVALQRQVDAGGAYELRDDDALGAVDDEGALLRHQREVAHEDLLLLDLARLLDDELDVHAQRRREGSVALPALVLRVLRLAEAVVGEAQLQTVTCEVLDRRDLVEELAQTFCLESLVGVELDLDEVRKRLNVRYA